MHFSALFNNSAEMPFVKVINIYYEGNNRFEIDIRYSLPDVLL